MITENDRQVLRRLAGQAREIADLPEMTERRRRLYDLNALRPDRPVVLCFPEGAWGELLPEEVLQCQDRLLRGWEMKLRQRLYWWEHIRDDNTLEPTFDLNWVVNIGDHGFAIENIRSEARGSYRWTPPVQDLQRDMSKLHFRPLSVDRQETLRRLALAEEAFGDLLQVKLGGSFWWTLGLTWEVIKLIGLEPLMLAMLDEPDRLHQLMAWMRDEHMHFIDWLEQEGLYTINNRNGYVGSGGVAYTDQLPQGDWQPGQPVRTIDLWGFAESQETVGISPAMFGEFVFPYQLPLLARFGLNCYGCCEAVHARWSFIRQIPRLRRVSVSPWADQRSMVEHLGGSYVFSRKPNPSPVCVGFNESVIRQDLRSTLDIARGLPVEIILKDTHTVQNQPERLSRWTAIAREEVERRI